MLTLINRGSLMLLIALPLQAAEPGDYAGALREYQLNQTGRS